ncbi:MAG: sugar ABC transporter permease [Deltaproteobacteria bacterium]|jgi:multiple sugar transport system permease protein|nr:sugar ABC transporter permease [Deltaproteobacteria bacterium]MBT6500804.1 sugar ABC transporter permease [Deltaproteobacteria bacterium]
MTDTHRTEQASDYISRLEPDSRMESLLDLIDRNIRWLFSLPAILVMLLLFAYPLAQLIWTSFTNTTLSSVEAPKFVGLANYIRAFTQDTHFWDSFFLTLYYAVGATIGQLLLGLVLALFLNKQFKGEAVFRMLIMFPLIATPVAMSLVWSLLMNPMMGHLNYYLSLIGIGPSLWAADTKTVMPTLIGLEIWHHAPMAMLVLLAGLRSLPREPFEAARVDGASRLRIFFHVTLPLLKPYIFLLLLLRIIHSLKVFDKIFVISGGGPNRASETLNITIYQQAFGSMDYGYASVLSVIMLLLILMISFSIFRFRERQWRY